MGMIDRITNAFRGDGWENVILGLGGTKDPSAYTTFTPRGRVTDELLEAVYIEDHFAAKVIEAIPREALRAGWDLWLTGEPSRVAAVRKRFKMREDELGVLENMMLGAYMGRLFGGAVTWIGADDGQSPQIALKEDSIESIRFLHTFDRRDVRIARYYADPSHPKFRQPERFEIRPRITMNAGNALAFNATRPVGVHESRVVVWNGQPTTQNRRTELQGWDDSVLERCWDALRQLAEDYGAKSLFLGRLSQSVYKLKDLWGMIAGNREEVLRKRMSLLDTSRSRSRAVLLDTEEDFVNVGQPMGGLDSILDRSVLRLAAAADMPVTILMGQSPAGFDATGEGDLEVWASRIDAWRKTDLRQRHERIAQLILLAADGPRAGLEPSEWEIRYRPLRTPTPSEQADLDLKIAQTDALNVDRGIYPAEVAAFRYGPVGGRIQLDEAELTTALKRRRELSKQPPKDNAELGTVSPRSSAVLDLLERVTTEKLSRESAKAILVEVFRYTEDVAEQVLGPKDFEPKVPTPPPNGSPGPAPNPPNGEGAGAPQGMPGFNAGGERQPEPPTP